MSLLKSAGRLVLKAVVAVAPELVREVVPDKVVDKAAGVVDEVTDTLGITPDFEDLGEYSFDRAIADLLSHEGVYSEDPSDRGGQTVYGIARARTETRWAGFWSRVDQILETRGESTPAEAIIADDELLEMVKAIYRADYWEPLNPDRWPCEWLRAKVFNFGVNVGPVTAVMQLQRMLNDVWPTGDRLGVDGVFGEKTALRIREVLRWFGERNLLRLYSLWQVRYYRDIANRDRSQRVFLLGWLNRSFYLVENS